jgi:hypothetical protein
MTERKPPGMNFTSWIDQQISEAAERGAFENLPGAGKPLPPRPGNDDGTAWIRDKLQREGVSADELLPPPLKLRKERHRLIEGVPAMRSEQEVTDAVRELVDLDAMLLDWRAAHPAPRRTTQLGAETPSAARPPRAGRWRFRGLRGR